MTLQEEEAQHDISNLQEKVHQISLSQRSTRNELEVLKKGMETEMDGLKKGVEAKMNGLEAKMDGMEANMDEMEAKINEKMKEYIENMKNDLIVDIEGLAKLIQEMFPNGEKIVDETHDEN